MLYFFFHHEKKKKKMTLPKLSALVPLTYPSIVPYLQSQDMHDVLLPYQSYYFHHPRSFLARFLIVLSRTYLADRDFWYVLDMGGHHYVSVFSVHYKGRVRFNMETVHVVSMEDKEYKTVFHKKTWTSIDSFLEAVFHVVSKHFPHQVYNFYDNQINARYTPALFLKRTQPISFSAQQLQFRNRPSPSTPTSTLDLGPAFSDIRRAETYLERILSKDLDMGNWYESMQFSRKVPRPRKIRAEFYEPVSVYRSH